MAEYYISSTKFSWQRRETKLNGTVWDIVFRIVTKDGEEKQKKLSGFKTKAAAKEAHAEFITEHCELVKNNPIKKSNKGYKNQLTVGELIDLYLKSLANQNKDSSIYDKTNVYRLYILPKYADQKPSVLTKDELYRWQDELWAMKNPRTGEFYSYAYLAKTRAHFGAFLAWCESRHGIKNYLPEVAKPKRSKPKKEMDIWTREIFDKFISEVDEPMYKCLFTIMFYTGRRKGELFALCPADIKLSATPKKPSTLTINKSISRKTTDGKAYKITTTKANKSQTIPICEVAASSLREYEAQEPFVFGGEKPLAENTVTRAFEKYCKKSEVPQIRIHDLRHSFVSMLIHYGANFTVVADLIGDTLEQVTKTYAHLYEEDKQAVLAKIK